MAMIICPKCGKAITGYDYEPWHFRYLDSTEIAHEIMDKGLTLEEYLGAAS
jgi:D-alanyl-D-alanine carboxypeptidase